MVQLKSSQTSQRMLPVQIDAIWVKPTITCRVTFEERQREGRLSDVKWDSLLGTMATKSKKVREESLACVRALVPCECVTMIRMSLHAYESDDLFVPASVGRANCRRISSCRWQEFFPSPTATTAEGLLCIGGRLTPEWLLDAYTHGIFPWPMWDDEPIAWWSPNPRAVIELRCTTSFVAIASQDSQREVSRNMRPRLRRRDSRLCDGGRARG